MTTRTSKKQMHEVDELFRATFPNGTVYAAGEYDASASAYIKLNGEVTRYASNTEAMEAALEMMFEHDMEAM